MVLRKTPMVAEPLGLPSLYGLSWDEREVAERVRNVFDKIKFLLFAGNAQTSKKCIIAHTSRSHVWSKNSRDPACGLNS